MNKTQGAGYTWNSKRTGRNRLGHNRAFLQGKNDEKQKQSDLSKKNSEISKKLNKLAPSSANLAHATTELRPTVYATIKKSLEAIKNKNPNLSKEEQVQAYLKTLTIKERTITVDNQAKTMECYRIENQYIPKRAFESTFNALKFKNAIGSITANAPSKMIENINQISRKTPANDLSQSASDLSSEEKTTSSKQEKKHTLDTVLKNLSEAVDQSVWDNSGWLGGFQAFFLQYKNDNLIGKNVADIRTFYDEKKQALKADPDSPSLKSIKLNTELLLLLKGDLKPEEFSKELVLCLDGMLNDSKKYPDALDQDLNAIKELLKANIKRAIAPRDSQVDAIEAFENKGMLLLPMGFGKTVIASLFALVYPMVMTIASTRENPDAKAPTDAFQSDLSKSGIESLLIDTPKKLEVSENDQSRVEAFKSLIEKENCVALEAVTQKC